MRLNSICVFLIRIRRQKIIMQSVIHVILTSGVSLASVLRFGLGFPPPALLTSALSSVMCMAGACLGAGSSSGSGSGVGVFQAR